MLIYKQAHDKIYNKTCATSEDTDQPAHPRSLIRVFADRMCFLQPPGYPKRDKREPLQYWVDVQADLSLCWSHGSYCRFCHALVHIFFFFAKKFYLYILVHKILYVFILRKKQFKYTLNR